MRFQSESREDWSARCLFEKGIGLALASFVFVFAALVSLATSWILVTRLERVGGLFIASYAVFVAVLLIVS